MAKSMTPEGAHRAVSRRTAGPSRSGRARTPRLTLRAAWTAALLLSLGLWVVVIWLVVFTVG